MRVIRGENPPTKLQRALLHRQRILMSTEGTVCGCEVVHGGADIRVIRGRTRRRNSSALSFIASASSCRPRAPYVIARLFMEMPISG